MVVLLLTTTAWAFVPMVVGLRPHVITSDSMAPALVAGDLVLVADDPGTDLAPGAIVVFDRGGERYAHRVAEVLGNGRYRTRGDANGAPDSTVLEAADVEGVGRLVIPLAGWLLVRAREAPWTAGVMIVAGLAVALYSARYALRDEFDPWAGPVRRRRARAAVLR